MQPVRGAVWIREVFAVGVCGDLEEKPGEEEQRKGGKDNAVLYRL